MREWKSTESSSVDMSKNYCPDPFPPDDSGTWRMVGATSLVDHLGLSYFVFFWERDLEDVR